MKITLCGSLASIQKMQEIQKHLEKAGHEVQMPPTTVQDQTGQDIPVISVHQQRHDSQETTGWIWDQKAQAMQSHFEKVAWSDAILVVNEMKHGVPNYIGENTLMEMGLAFYLGKKIFLVNPIPKLPYTEEIIGLRPVVINGDLLLVR